MNESLYDNIVKSINMYYEGRQKSIRKGITPVNNDRLTDYEGRPLLVHWKWQETSCHQRLTEEKNRVFMECHASNYVGRDNTMKKICERFFWPEYHKDTISRIMRLEYFYFTYRIYSNKRCPRISAASGTKKLISAALE